MTFYTFILTTEYPIYLIIIHIEFIAGVIDQKGMLTPARYQIPRGSVFALPLSLYCVGFMKSMNARCPRLFIQQQYKTRSALNVISSKVCLLMKCFLYVILTFHDYFGPISLLKPWSCEIHNSGIFPSDFLSNDAGIQSLWPIWPTLVWKPIITMTPFSQRCKFCYQIPYRWNHNF